MFQNFKNVHFPYMGLKKHVWPLLGNNTSNKNCYKQEHGQNS